MADDPYAKFFVSSEANQEPVVIQNEKAIGPSGEKLNLQPNTGGANIYGATSAPVTDLYAGYFAEVPEKNLPASDPNNLTSSYTQSVAQATPQDTKDNDPYARFLIDPSSTPSPTPEQAGKVINLPAMPWYENLARSAAAQTEAGAIRTAGGFERAGAAPVTDISGVNAPFQRGATTKEATSAFDSAIADKQSALDSIKGIVKKQGFSSAEYDNQINDLQQQIGDLEAQKEQTLQLPQYAPEAQQQLAEQRQQLGEQATALSEQANEAFPAWGVNQQDTSISAQLGRGLGGVIGLAPAFAAGPFALPAMVVMGGSEAYGEGYDSKVSELKQQGVTDKSVLEAAGHKAGSEAAVATVPALAAYTVGGELTAKATGALMKGASPLARAAVAGTAAAGVNLATSGALRTMQGGNFLPNVEQAVPDLVFGGISAIHAGMAPSSNPVVNQREAEINARANAQAEVPLTPDQEKINQQWQIVKKQAADVAQKLGELPEDHPERPALQERAAKLAQQIADLREGKSVDIQPEQTQGDERFAPKPNETTQNQEQETGGVSSVEGVSAEAKPEGKAEEGTPQPQGEGAEVKGAEGEPAKTTEAELREAYPNTAFFGEADEAIQRLNSEDARTNKRPRFAPASLRDLLELKNNPAYKLADKLAGIFGKKIVFYKGEEGTKINGATGRDPALKNYIFLKVDGARPHLFTAGHELWHHIELYSPVLATDLRQQIKPLIKDWAGIEQKYKAAGYEKDRWFDEHIGDFLGDAMQDPSFWNTLAKKNPKTFKELATKTVDWLNKLLYQLKDWKMGGDYTRDIEKARDMLAEGLNKFAEGKDEPISEPPKAEAPEEGKGPMFQQDAEEKRNKDFYSQLQRTIADKMPNKASVEQIKAIIDPAKGSGVKPDELKWSNLEGFLEGKKNVTKQEVLDYLKNEGAVKFEERTLGDQEAMQAEDRRQSLDMHSVRMAVGLPHEAMALGMSQLDAANLPARLTDGRVKVSDLHPDLQQAAQQYIDAHLAYTKEANKPAPIAPKYGQYVLPNGENYREVVLTMPNDFTPKAMSWDAIGMEKFGKPYSELTEEQFAEVEKEAKKRKEENSIGYQKQNEYKSTHFRDIPNYVAHMRLDERQDSTGAEGLFIEEIQSDRHQKGREVGYAGENEGEIPQGYQLRDMNEEARQQGYNFPSDAPQRWKFSANDYSSRQYSSREEALAALKEHASKSPKGIPDAPFRKDWSVQMFKRALRDAVASGKEWIGWTSGETQAGRYDLSKQVDALMYVKKDDGTYRVDFIPKGRNGEWSNLGNNLKESDLADNIGKEIAEKIVNGEGEPNTFNGTTILRGVDLKVGGEGMKGFYDQILPKEIGKYVKKWGAKVEEGDIKTNPKEYDTTPIWKVEITPEMRESVSKEGQPMFQQDRPTEQEASKKREEIMQQAAPVVKKTRNTIVNTFKRKPAKEAISYMRDAGDNAANIYAKEQTNEVANDLKREFKAKKDKAADALSFVIEAKGDQNELGNMRQKIENSPDASPAWKKKALAAIEFADNNFSRFDPIAQKYEQIGLHQVAQENANGIDTPVREGYVPHYQDLEEQELFGGSGTGSATGFRKMRTYDTFADSIANGVDPKSINAVDLLQKRLSSGQKSINYRSWIDSLKGTIDPASGDPIATKVSIVKRPDGSSYLQVPRGYHQETLAGQRVAIKDGYEGIISALNDPSAWSKNMVAKTIQKTSGAGKSITLGLDTYHLGRIAIWNSLIKSLGITTFKLPTPSYRKGATLLDQTLPEIQKMIANGEIPKSYAKGLVENKRLLNLAVKTGYNVGGIADSLHQDWIHKIPGLGDFNSWLFNQFQRGAMAESWLLEFQRYRKAYPKLSESEVARMVSKDLNTRYGNLGRQGILKSKTMQDTARFLFLAPQWNEGLIRTEIGALGQAGKALLDAATGKRLFAGILARSVGGMVAAQFVANQLINYATRGTPTWDNPEEGIGAKLSAYIPDFWGGPGFFLNPMSLATETTHLLMKGYERTGNTMQTAMDYFRSRSSVPMRPVWDAVTNKDFLGKYYAPGQLWQGMLKDSLPIPIAGGAIYSAAKEGITGEPNQQFAGQYQKQLFSTFGVKLEQAPSDESRVFTMANHFKLENNIQDRMAGYSSPYSELNHALVVGNMTNAKNAMTKIMQTKSPKEIEKYYKHTYQSMRVLESNAQLKDFLNTLTDEQRNVYDRAKEHRKDTANAALDLLKEME